MKTKIVSVKIPIYFSQKTCNRKSVVVYTSCYKYKKPPTSAI